MTYGVTQVESEPLEWLTKTCPFWVQVAQSVPVESLSMTSVSVRNVLIVAGKPASSV
jgi:hypothetical protein